MTNLGMISIGFRDQLFGFFVFLISMTISVQSYGWFQFYVQQQAGYTEFEEERNSTKYANKSYFDVGFGTGARLNLPIAGVFYIGGMAEVDWIGHDFNRWYFDAPSGGDRSTGYRVERVRYLAGPYISIRPVESFSINFEYYAHNSMNIIYSDDKSVNPFRKHERHTGNGWGAGFSGYIWFVFLSIMGRETKIVNYNFDTTNDFPKGGVYREMKSTEISTQVGIDF